MHTRRDPGIMLRRRFAPVDCTNLPTSIAYQCSRLQTACHKPLVSFLLYANRAFRHTQVTHTAGMHFRPCLEWPTRQSVDAGLPPRICIAAVSDASHGSEDAFLSDRQGREAFISQGGKLVIFADTDILAQGKAHVHIVSFASAVQKGVVSST